MCSSDLRDAVRRQPAKYLIRGAASSQRFVSLQLPSIRAWCRAFSELHMLEGAYWLLSAEQLRHSYQSLA